jgi:hypothetical protein
MARRSQVDGQLAIDERVIEDPGVEAALEERERCRLVRVEANGAYKRAHRIARELVDGLGADPIDVPLRIGRFRIEAELVKGRHVSFDTDDRTAVHIEPVTA